MVGLGAVHSIKLDFDIVAEMPQQLFTFTLRIEPPVAEDAAYIEGKQKAEGLVELSVE